MLIDWFTVGAQTLNFLILVWLLKRFLYKPILQAIDARENLIAKQLEDAAAKNLTAQKSCDEFQQKNKAFDTQRVAGMSKATDDAQAEYQRLVALARVEADGQKARQVEALRIDTLRINETIIRRAQDEVFAISRKVLSDLSATNLEDRMSEMFIQRLREMDGKARDDFARNLKAERDPAVVRTAFDLSPGQRSSIQNALNETFSREVRVSFETTPRLVCGIELKANGQKIEWNISSYMASLEKSVDELSKLQSPSESDSTRISVVKGSSDA
jgi:F-type H+-transporting ATPase subunit b